ncbi:MAG: hypothetical protein IJZ53_06365 [Tyzzerella sp.]|nr:hypothetical protein [Tyzzerella sp.]
MKAEEYEAMMTEEEREQMTRQQYLHQLDMLRTVNTFLLMGYGKDIKGIYEGMKALHYICSEDQIDFYCEFIGTHKGETIQEINDALWRFLWETEPPEIPEPEEEESGEKPYRKKSIQSYMCRIVVLNLLVDRIDYLRSVMKANRFEMTHFINAGYDACYVKTMKRVIEENLEMHSRDIARRVYRLLYQDAKHMDGFIYSIDKLDFWDMIHTCRDKWQTARKQYEEEERCE